ncbi:exonuclease SbcCD subunit D [Candidatus Woesearchaeota archaeon]|nr:exonuclease SbcCD subunit D [Candidatus Woesearchaeota archaeon]
MKFAHLSDIHIGGWREPKLRDASTIAFCRAMEMCIAERVDFVLISGDLFNTSMPPMDHLREAVGALRRAREAGIPAYSIPGSHDFSPSGKTMLDVLETAGLLIGVARGSFVEGKLRLEPVVDARTGITLVGMMGKKGGLEKHYYPALDYAHLESLPSPKIFLFHSAITELKPKDLADMDALSASYLPEGFDYYAGGHVHVVDVANLDGRKNVVFPGPLFPNSFSELEKLRTGGFVIVDDWKPRHIPVVVHPHLGIVVDCHNRPASEIEGLITSCIDGTSLSSHVVTLRLRGELSNGRLSDIPWRQIIDRIMAQGAYAILRNTNELRTPEIEHVNVQTGNLDEIEHRVITENLGRIKHYTPDEERSVIGNLMTLLSSEKHEGETQAAFEKRIIDDARL